MGYYSYQSQSYPLDANASPLLRLASKGDLLAPQDIVQPPMQHGRNDPIALLGRGLAANTAQKKAEDADKDARKGNMKRMTNLQGNLQWLMIRRASPNAIAQWKNCEAQSDAALRQGAA
jgi:hypothetical protein